MKIILKIIFLILVTFFTSCGIFRSIGLYNVPPNYFETYEEITGNKFVPHSNKTDSLIITLKSIKPEYTPYDSTKLELKLLNLGSDTIFIYKPMLTAYSPPLRELVVRDSSNRKMRVLEYSVGGNGAIMRDKYGRRIIPTIAPNGFKLSPKDSLIEILSFRTGDRITNDLYSSFTFVRENKPGKYKAYYIQEHEEYDKIKGPIPTKIKSTEAEYRVSNYTNDELALRNEVKEITSAVNNNSDSLKIEVIFSKFRNKHPDNIYIPQIKEYLRTYFFLKNYNKEKK